MSKGHSIWYRIAQYMRWWDLTPLTLFITCSRDLMQRTTLGMLIDRMTLNTMLDVQFDSILPAQNTWVNSHIPWLQTPQFRPHNFNHFVNIPALIITWTWHEFNMIHVPSCQGENPKTGLHSRFFWWTFAARSMTLNIDIQESSSPDQ